MGFYKKHGNFKQQNYAKIKKQLSKSGSLFNDPLFLAQSSILGDIDNLPQQIEWKRPNMIFESPRLFKDITSPKELSKSKFSCPWFVSACSVLSGFGEIWHKVIPDYWEQEWDTENTSKYLGIFHFRFWHFGEWIDVVIDDQLPTVDGQLIFIRSTSKNEFWAPLLEKAYAKLHGSYAALIGGHFSNALVDFTGGVSQVIRFNAEEYSDIDDKKTSLFELLQEEIKDHSLLCSIITAPEQSPSNRRRNEMGLLYGFPYVITDAKRVSLGESNLRTLFKGRVKCQMIRLRDPQGEGNGSATHHRREMPDEKNELDHDDEQEDVFAYSSSKLTHLLSRNSAWAKVKNTESIRLGLDHTDNEFWMPIEDFIEIFNELNLVRMYNTNLFALSRTWKTSYVKGTWEEGVTAGGDITHEDTYLKNPQYMFDVIGDQEELIFQMQQMDFRELGSRDYLQIGFIVIKVEENRKYKLHKQYDYLPTVITFENLLQRDIFYQGHLARGRYVILPATIKPGQIGAFHLRIFSNNNINLRGIKLDAPKHPTFWCIFDYPVWVSVITIKRATDLECTRYPNIDAYCVIKCENEKYQTVTVRNTSNPEWNSSYVLFRKNIDMPIVIQVFNHHNLLSDTFLGRVQLPAPVNNAPSPLQVALSSKNMQKDDTVNGQLELEVYTQDNFHEV